MKLRTLLFLPAIFFCNLSSSVAHEQAIKMKLWPKGAPGSIKNDSYKEKTNAPNHSLGCIERVTDAEITVFLPETAKATGAAVLIIPGGGYGVVCIEHEGFQIAKWLNENGIAGIVLKYRLPSDLIMKDKTIGPLQDAQEAMRLIRKNADAWGIKSNKIGVLGFSAGGHLAASLSTHYNKKVYENESINARPDFSILIYPVISFDSKITHMGSRKNLIGENPSEEKIDFFSNELQVNKDTPPAILIHSTDDKAVPVANSLRYFEALNANNITTEMHIFERGGHGYGLGLNNNGTERQWSELCIEWMKMKVF